MRAQSRSWHYPRWVAHRGAGRLAPENTLAAFRLGATFGFRMFECDVKLSADAVPFLLHDTTLERTTTGLGAAGDRSWHELSLLDAGKWHSRAYAGEPIPSLERIAAFCIRNQFLLNIEIKPSPGNELTTGEVVAEHAEHLWREQPVPPLLTSFSTVALHAARGRAPRLPRGLLLDTLPGDWVESALELDSAAVICNHSLWDQSTVELASKAGLRTLSYTVNDDWAAQRLINLGTDSIITDRVDFFTPAG